MSKSVDLSVRMGDITFQNPFIVGAGPTAKTVVQIKAVEDSGWTGVSVKLAIDPFPYITWQPRYRWLRKENIHILTAKTHLKIEEALKLLEDTRKAISRVVLIPTITYGGKDREDWVRMARPFEEAGAHAIELNMCCPNMSFNVQAIGMEIESRRLLGPAWVRIW